LKSVRNLHVSAVIAAALSLCLAFLLWFPNSDLRKSDFLNTGSEGFSAFGLVCLIVGTAGVIWFGWYWHRLSGGIESLTRQLRAGQRYDVKGGGRIIKELAEVVEERLCALSERTAKQDEQIRDLQIQVRLSRGQTRNTEAIIYSIRDAVLVVDAYDKLLMANEAAGKLFGFDFKASQRKPVRELMGESGGGDSSRKEFVEFLRQTGNSKARGKRREITFSDGENPKTFECIVSCMYDHEDEVCGVVAVLHNITREKEISQMKNDFVSHVSHELKTPLASITAYSEMLADGEASNEETRREFYSVIQTQAQRLNRLIEDILNVSRIESGLIKVSKEAVSLTILVEEQMQMTRGYAEEKGIEIIGQKPIVFDQVYVDRDMVSQVIVNLLGNAVKYTPSGGSVTVKTEVDEVSKIARVSVTDTGVGIPEEEVEHVFDKFYRVEANKSQAKGTGLGLNLVKQIVTKVHDGRVFVSSEQGRGSTFGFELPLASEQEEFKRSRKKKLVEAK